MNLEERSVILSGNFHSQELMYKSKLRHIQAAADISQSWQINFTTAACVCVFLCKTVFALP